MEPISTVGQLVETLRKQLSEAQNRPGVLNKAPGSTPASSASGRADVDALRQKIQEKLRRVNATDPKAEQKSIRIFLESVLLWEFGERLMDDPKFYALLDDVQHSMESDPAIHETLATLLAQLK